MTATTSGKNLYFLKRFLQSPRNVASVLPSSRFLSQQMVQDLDWQPDDVVVELGPGTGAFTPDILAQAPAGQRIRYLGIEKDPGMHAFLTRRFPQLDFALGDAADLAQHLAARELPPAAAIISGLPLIFFGSPDMQRVLRSCRANLRPGGVFRTFSYVHSYPRPSAAELRHMIGEHFEALTMSRPILLNLPPALTLTGRVPQSQGNELKAA